MGNRLSVFLRSKKIEPTSPASVAVLKALRSENCPLSSFFNSKAMKDDGNAQEFIRKWFTILEVQSLLPSHSASLLNQLRVEEAKSEIKLCGSFIVIARGEVKFIVNHQASITKTTIIKPNLKKEQAAQPQQIPLPTSHTGSTKNTFFICPTTTTTKKDSGGGGGDDVVPWSSLLLLLQKKKKKFSVCLSIMVFCCRTTTFFEGRNCKLEDVLSYIAARETFQKLIILNSEHHVAFTSRLVDYKVNTPQMNEEELIKIIQNIMMVEDYFGPDAKFPDDEGKNLFAGRHAALEELLLNLNNPQPSSNSSSSSSSSSSLSSLSAADSAPSSKKDILVRLTRFFDGCYDYMESKILKEAFNKYKESKDFTKILKDFGVPTDSTTEHP